MLKLEEVSRIEYVKNLITTNQNNEIYLMKGCHISGRILLNFMQRYRVRCGNNYHDNVFVFVRSCEQFNSSFEGQRPLTIWILLEYPRVSLMMLVTRDYIEASVEAPGGII